jgi:hypothetical protein
MPDILPPISLDYADDFGGGLRSSLRPAFLGLLHFFLKSLSLLPRNKILALLHVGILVACDGFFFDDLR